MSTTKPFNPSRSASARSAGAAGAAASSVLVLGALLVLFHQAAPAHWRTDESVLQAAAAECREAGFPAGVPDGHLLCMDEALARHAAGAERVALAATR